MTAPESNAVAVTASTVVTITPPPPSSIISQETLRERILTGGGGIGNVRLSKVASLYADFSRSLQQQQQVVQPLPSSTSSADTTTVATNHIIAAQRHALEMELQLHDIEMHKLLLSCQACDGNSSRDDASLSQIESLLSSTHSDIQHLSSTLNAERQIKHNLQEFNALAKLGNMSNNPPICVTRLELEQVQQTIHNVKQEMKQAQLEILVREKQLRVVMASLVDLRSTLLEEEVWKKHRQRRDGEQVAEKGDRSSSINDTDDEGTAVQKRRKRVLNDDNDIRLTRDDNGDDVGAL